MNNHGYFFNYASCVEELCYCQSPETTVRRLAANGDLLIPITDWYESTYRRSLLDEVTSPTFLDSPDLISIRSARITQLALFLCAATVMRKNMAPTHTAGYSLGYGAAFSLSETLTFPLFAQDVFSANLPYARANLQALQSDKLRSCFLYDPVDLNFNAKVRGAIMRGFPDVVIKDDRPPYGMQVVAKEAILTALRDWVFAEFPAAEAGSTRMIASDSAHLHPEQYHAVKQAFRQARYSTPTMDIITHQHGILDRGVPLMDGGGILFDAIQSPLSMRRVIDGLLQYDGPLIVFGSSRTSSFVFYGLGDQGLGRPIIHWELALSRNDISSPT